MLLGSLLDHLRNRTACDKDGRRNVWRNGGIDGFATFWSTWRCAHPIFNSSATATADQGCTVDVTGEQQNQSCNS